MNMFSFIVLPSFFSFPSPINFSQYHRHFGILLRLSSIFFTTVSMFQFHYESSTHTSFATPTFYKDAMWYVASPL